MLTPARLKDFSYGSHISHIAEDHLGQLWIGTWSGLLRFDQQSGNFHGLEYGQVTALFADTIRGTIICGMVERLLYYPHPLEEPRFFQPPKPDWTISGAPDLAIREILIDQREENAYWLATNHGLCLFNYENESYMWQGPEPKASFASAALDARGNLHLGTWTKGIYRYDPVEDIWAQDPLDPSISLPSGYGLEVTDVQRIPELGLVAASGTTGILHLSEKGLWRSVSQPGLGRLSSPRFLHFDRQHILWTAWQRGGISKIDPRTDWISYRDVPLLASRDWGWVSAFLEDTYRDEFLIGTFSLDGLQIYNRGDFNHAKVILPAETFLKSSEGRFEIVELHKDQQGRVWVLSKSGTFIRQGDELLPFAQVLNLPVHLQQHEFRSFLQDSRGRIWLGSKSAGVFCLEEGSGQVRHFRHDAQDPSSLPSDMCWRQMAEDAEGNVWIPTMKGPAYVDPDAVLHRVPLPGYYAQSGAFAMLAGQDGSMWISSAGAGLHRYKQGEWTHWGTEEGLPDNRVLRMRFDSRQQIWMTTENGVVLMNPSTEQFRIIDERDGIYGGEIGDSPLFIDQNDRVFLGAGKGFFHWHIDALPERAAAIALELSHVEVMGKRWEDPVDSKAGLKLSWKENYFSLRFAGLELSRPEDLRFRYRLTGYDPNWITPGEERVAWYTRVKPGKYSFEVQMAGIGDAFGETSLSLPIIIVPPFWMWWSFRIGLALLLIGLLALGISLRMQAIRRKEEWKKRLLELETAALRSQMNPHFLFNSLNSIRHYILKHDKYEAADYLTKFSKLIRMILQNSRKNSIELQDELDALRLYLELESLRLEGRFEYSIKVDQMLLDNTTFLPPLILQPFAENAIWHGLMPKEGKGKLEITLSVENDELICTIEDDGIGRKASAAMREDLGGQSLGSSITKDRLEMSPVLKKMKASVEYFDLVNASGDPSGTTVKLRLPLNSDLIHAT